MEKKKLLITTDSFLPRLDGVSIFIREIIPFLKQEYEITVIAPDFEENKDTVANKEMDGINIIRMPLMNIQFSDMPFSKPNKKVIKSLIEKNDIIFNQAIGPIGKTAIINSYALNKPLVSFVHSIDWELASKSVRRFRKIVRVYVKRRAVKLYNKCNFLIVPTKEVSKILSETGIKTKKYVANLGVNSEKFVPPEDKAKAKENIELGPQKIVIGYCGRIGREKNLETLKKAFEELKKKHINIQLLIVGGGSENQMEELKGENIILTGIKENVIPYYQAMDIFVMPSLTETTSLSTLEAMSCGIPIIATPVGYLKEYIKKDINGFFFPKKSAYGLRKRLKELVTDSEKRQLMGRLARKTIISDHRWDISAGKIIKLIEMVNKNQKNHSKQSKSSEN